MHMILRTAFYVFQKCAIICVVIWILSLRTMIVYMFIVIIEDRKEE